ncbi:hypothetical protein [Streptomyces clavuligerus]|uniref:hypothetical protein n=1 Tax=Streptomyces clavuligerus TaxID=1901 RepID=UPI0001800A7D|nr:hypothetical protein [Streptomyces clavuligerus]EDY52719.1 hypothetical protein SSCG_05747 [Streptomyces clavuligerus]WDN55874.1 hypothetical protein LL058_28665 [Streptomyces clavuligerus]
MATDFRQLQCLAHGLGLTYQQLLARYHAEHGRNAPRTGALSWARLRALDASFTDSLLRTPAWTPLFLRLDADLLTRLVARADTDQTQRPSIAPRHYIDAALRTGPRRPEEHLACGKNFLQVRRARTEKITVHLSPDSHAVLSRLRSVQDGSRPLVHAAASALTDRMLDTLPSQLAAPPLRRARSGEGSNR